MAVVTWRLAVHNRAMSHQVESPATLITLRRALVGTVAIACLCGAATLWWLRPEAAVWYASLLRAGVVLSVLWLALPSRSRPAAWAQMSPLTAGILAATLLLTMRMPKVGIPLLLMLILLRYVFTPRTRRK